jgi:hypothetical protein
MTEVRILPVDATIGSFAVPLGSFSIHCFPDEIGAAESSSPRPHSARSAALKL